MVQFHRDLLEEAEVPVLIELSRRWGRLNQARTCHSLGHVSFEKDRAISLVSWEPFHSSPPRPPALCAEWDL